jgi:hypothetical protein
MRGKRFVTLLVTMADGILWENPDLGLVEFKGTKPNNIVDFPEPSPSPAAAIIYEPDEPDPSRRFKMVYEADRNRSPDLTGPSIENEGNNHEKVHLEGE